MQAVILAAGEGMRVRPLTRSRPKAMIPIANRPIIDYVIHSLVRNGIRDITVVVGYKKEQVIRYLNGLDLPVRVVVQERQLGTAHALKCASHEISGPFLLLPGDNYIDPSSIARIKDEPYAMLVKDHPNPSNFGVVIIREGLVRAIVEKPEFAPSHTVSTGIYSLQQDALDYLESTEIPDAIGSMLQDGIPIKAVHADDWQDAIYPWDILKMNGQLLKTLTPRRGGTISREASIHGSVAIGKGTKVGAGTILQGPLVIGNDCDIGPNCCIMPGTSIGSRVVIEPFSYVGSSLLMDDVRIGSHSRIVEVVTAEGCVIADHTSSASSETIFEIGGKVQKAKFGAIIGDTVKSAPFTVFKNCIVGNNVEIREGRTISRMVPDGVVVM
jgi:glucose-1-phosphate thymidylyltransferase